ncbi:B12-binding domain-containing radical SAM protein [Rhodospirillum sp. A1_3_36]|uniref:B12-binding domain-containing radical SAM protein n=1 Tax=Rhodospirillum sp. A1_3_36 TaxID=3391666 RepID=UPI0039A44D2E
MRFTYDMPLYRPPSEGDNLILQATLGCGHNTCAFCSMYRTKTYTVRPLDAVIADMEAAAAVWPDAHRVFLADGDALRLPASHLMALLEALAQRFPRLARVSCYATPGDILRKTEAELEALRAAKLSLLYLGVESGEAETLKRIAKGATPDSIARALTRAREAGMKVSATVILGLAGQGRWRAHAEATAALINKAPPTYLSTLQLHLDPLQKAPFLKRQEEDFAFQDDLGVLSELEVLLERLAPPTPVIFRSNHASNALALAGNLPKDGPRLLSQVRAAREGLAGLRPRWEGGLRPQWERRL